MCQVVISLALLAVISPIIAQYGNGPTVKTSQGSIIGLNATDGAYYIFYGIPYAGSTAGSNRFKAPTAPPNFPGDFHATDSSKLCAQPTSSGLVGDEDCLVLNIFTRNLTTPKPVLVWIDGQDYTVTNPNNAQYTYRKLVEQDLVVVSINYRLSVFGFLCLGVEGAPGNAGLKDIIAGLQWIQQNIAQFGGDPNNVVLFGYGSGGAMVDLITLSPLAANLVHKAIAASGTSLAPWAIAYNPVEYAEALGQSLGYVGKTRSELAELLSTTQISILSAALSNFEFLNNTALFAPCIEDANLQPNNTFLSRAPIDIIKSGNYNQIPFIAGYSNRDGTLRIQQALFRDWFTNMTNNFTNAVQADLGNKVSITPTIKEFYFGNRVINAATIEDYFDYQGDTMFLISTIRTVVERALTSRAPVRLYQFAFRGTLNSDWAYPGVAITGARYGSILNYLFDYDLSNSDSSVQQSLVSRWATFAKSGVPTTTGSVDWSAVTSSQIHYLAMSGGELSPNVTTYSESSQSNPHSERRTFWDGIYSTNYVAPRPVSGSNTQLGFALVIVFFQVLMRLL